MTLPTGRLKKSTHTLIYEWLLAVWDLIPITWLFQASNRLDGTKDEITAIKTIQCLYKIFRIDIDKRIRINLKLSQN